MSADPPPLPLNPGLRTRFRLAGEKIAWIPTVSSPELPRPRMRRRAQLREEEAVVEEWGSETDGGLMVESGPLGALVLLLAFDRRGLPTTLGASYAGHAPGFPSGAIVAIWGSDPAPTDERPRFQDVVDLARYALE